jgi:NAD(P)-dependent dehydrogenase (short-subunit alcohol dehydrogenase family)
MSVAGRVAVVTGAAGAIGGAIAERLAREGARVRIVDLAAQPADRAPVGASGADIQARAIDVGDHAAVAATFGEPDWAPEILVNVAGVFDFEDIGDASSTAWERTMRVNLTGVYNCCHAAAAQMRERRFGRIVSISSNAALMGFGRMPSYCASKAGIIGLSRSLAVDLGPYNVTVNVVAPGSIDAGMGVTSGWTSDRRMRA